MDTPRIRIGIGGWTYEPWRGSFYPDGLAQKRELEYAAGKLSSIEVNGSFYGSQKPETFALVLPPFGVKTYFGYIGRKDEAFKSLDDAIDAALVKIKKDGRMAKLQQNWFGTTFNTPDEAVTPNI